MINSNSVYYAYSIFLLYSVSIGIYYFNESRAHLQIEEKTLQLKRNRFFLLLFGAVKAPSIESVAEFGRHVKGLNQAVKVACHGLIHQADEY